MDYRLMKTLACDARLKILDYLNYPEEHFPDVPDAADTGLTNKMISSKLQITQESVSLHMKWLTKTNLVTSTRVGTRIFYKRNEDAIQKAIGSLIGIL
ncbi:ArsR/SmtB family transcription factor [Mesorhizobium sp. Cs1299R1N3]|uniref:ArsR/SmtB family transcription factor n=1 Tax=Mesorhizobium sp. Cs1299R1N3 TaxID=3015173 RepID=UPI00301C8654